MKQFLIIIGISVAFVGVIALVYKWFGFNLPMWVLISLILIGILYLVLLIRIGYTAQWGGFRGYDKVTKEYTTSDKLPSKTTREYQPGKKLWDWLQLVGVLLIPIVIFLATIRFNQQQADLAQQQHTYDQKIAQQNRDYDTQRALDQQEATILQTYIDNIQDLLLNHHLLESKPTDGVAVLARARTLAALQGLDPVRKGRLVQFIYEAGLINKPESIIVLTRADLTNMQISFGWIGTVRTSISLAGADFDGANMTGAWMRSVFLAGASLNFAVLEGAFLLDAFLDGAHLTNANLEEANLSGAHLTNADLQGADLLGADVSFTDFSGADLRASISQEQLDLVYSCKNAILPQGLTCHRTPSP